MKKYFSCNKVFIPKDTLPYVKLIMEVSQELTLVVDISPQQKQRYILNQGLNTIQIPFPYIYYFSSDHNEYITNIKVIGSVIKGRYLFNKMGEVDCSKLDTSRMTNMSHMFEGCKTSALDLSNFDVSNVTSYKGMFADMPNIETLDIQSLCHNKVTDFSYMFSTTPKLYEIKNIDKLVTNYATNLSYMFYKAGLSLEIGILELFYSWDLSNVTDISYMFQGTRIINADIYSWDMSNVTTMRSMFKNCTYLRRVIISPGNYPKNKKPKHLTDTGDMFQGDSQLQSIDLNIPLPADNYKNMFQGVPKNAYSKFTWYK